MKDVFIAVFIYLFFYIYMNLCCSDLSGAMQRCAAPLGLLQCGCAIYATFLPAV